MPIKSSNVPNDCTTLMVHKLVCGNQHRTSVPHFMFICMEKSKVFANMRRSKSEQLLNMATKTCEKRKKGGKHGKSQLNAHLLNNNNNNNN